MYYRDLLTGDIVLSDLYPKNEIINGMLWEVQGKLISKTFREPYAIVTSAVVDIADQFRLREVPRLEEHELREHINNYTELLMPELDAEKQELFKANIEDATRYLISKLHTKGEINRSMDFYRGQSNDSRSLMFSYQSSKLEEMSIAYVVYFAYGLEKTAKFLHGKKKREGKVAIPPPSPMMSTSFKSNFGNQSWIDQISKQLTIDIEPHPCVFRVSKCLVESKLEAYAPQIIGLGPYHHLKPELFQGHRKKIEALKKFLRPDQLVSFESTFVNKLESLDPIIRSCYNEYLDIDGETLRWIMAVDGTYLYCLLSTYSGKWNLNHEDRNLAQDIMMLENQIPVVVLMKIQKALQCQDDDNNEEEEDEDEEEDSTQAPNSELSSKFFYFCRSHSPLSVDRIDDTASKHLLAYMHQLILNYKHMDSIGYLISDSYEVDQVQEVARVAANVFGGTAAGNPLMFFASLPLQKLLELFKKDDKSENSVDEITIPSVSELHQVAKVEFKATSRGIGDIKFDENDRTFHLPVITLNTDSEVILRNLVAYETASATPGSNLRFADYVDFMCGIIDTAKDADILKGCGIIKGNLENEEIAKIFNGISKSTGRKVDLETATQKLNELYDNTFKIKVLTFIKNHFIPSQACVKLFLGILLVALLTVQAFCQVYGCSSHWFGKKLDLNLVMKRIFG